MTATKLSAQQKGVVEQKVSEFLGRVRALEALAPAERAEVVRGTAAIVESLATGPRPTTDPYDLRGLAPAEGLASSIGARGAYDDAPHAAPGQKIDGGAAKLIEKTKAGEIGSVIGAGVTQAARMVSQIDFPTFVASLIEGTFHAIVKSSIEQMRAYAEMVKSVSTSLNEFKDQNTTQNQARDHLVRKYPQLFQINIIDSQPKVGLRDEADTDNLPDFQKELGMAKEISDLDDETIENDLVPAAQDDLARGRQQLLATIILMGINRIIVTDGKINAKIKFQFSANEKRNVSASAFDYAFVGEKTTAKADEERQYTGAEISSQQGQGWNYTGPNSYAKGQYETTVEPDVRVTSQVDLTSDAAIQASGQIMGEVSVNFRSESFPLEKMVDTDQMMRLQQAQGPRGTALPAAAPAAPGAAGPLPQPPAASPAAPAQRA